MKRKFTPILLIFWLAITGVRASEVSSAVAQINYLESYNRNNKLNGVPEKNWYIYSVDGSVEDLKYIINETWDELSESFLKRLNDELIPLNTSGNAVYMAFTGYVNPLLVPYFDYEVVGDTPSLNAMEGYIQSLLNPNDLGFAKKELVNSLESFSVYKDNFLRQKEAMLEEIYNRSNLRKGDYKNVILPFTDYSIRQIIQPNGEPSKIRKYALFTLFLAKTEKNWDRREFQRLYLSSKTQIKSYGNSKIENKLERVINTLTTYSFGESETNKKDCQGLLQGDLYKDMRKKLLAVNDKIWLRLIEDNPCILSQIYQYDEGHFAEGAEEYEQELAKAVCYPLYGALAIPALTILGPTLIEEIGRNLLNKYGYKKLLDAGNAIAIDFSMQFVINYYFHPDVNTKTGAERYSAALSLTQLDDIAASAISSINNFDLPTELILACVAGGNDMDIKVLMNPERYFNESFDINNCGQNMMSYVLLNALVKNVATHTVTFSRFSRMIKDYPESIQRGLNELLGDQATGLLIVFRQHWQILLEKLEIPKGSNLYYSLKVEGRHGKDIDQIGVEILEGGNESIIKTFLREDVTKVEKFAEDAVPIMINGKSYTVLDQVVNRNITINGTTIRAARIEKLSNGKYRVVILKNKVLGSSKTAYESLSPNQSTVASAFMEGSDGVISQETANIFNDPNIISVQDIVIKDVNGNSYSLLDELTLEWAKWLDELETILGQSARMKIQAWIENGLDQIQFRNTFVGSSDKLGLFNKLENAKSIYHQKVIIKDFSIPGITKGQYISNSVDNITRNVIKTISNKSFTLKTYQAETFQKFGAINLRESVEVIEDLGNGIELVKVKPGTKLYRVYDGYQNGINSMPYGNYWAFEKPTLLDEVFGGAAVQPEWNSAIKIIEIEVPSEGILGWRGLAAKQPLSNNENISNYYLKGGAEQLIFDVDQNNISISLITKSITNTPW